MHLVHFNGEDFNFNWNSKSVQFSFFTVCVIENSPALKIVLRTHVITVHCPQTHRLWHREAISKILERLKLNQMVDPSHYLCVKTLNTTQHHNPYIHSAFREKFNSIWKPCIEIQIWIIYLVNLIYLFFFLGCVGCDRLFIFVQYFRQYTEEIQFEIVYSVIWNCWSFLHCQVAESDYYYYMERTVVWQLQKKKKCQLYKRN